jgi:hypothetical protein
VAQVAVTHGVGSHRADDDDAGEIHIIVQRVQPAFVQDYAQPQPHEQCHEQRPLWIDMKYVFIIIYISICFSGVSVCQSPLLLVIILHSPHYSLCSFLIFWVMETTITCRLQLFSLHGRQY